jgi:transposase
MELRSNAALGPKGRLTMVRRVVDQDWSLAEAAEAAGVSERTCWKWVGRYRAEGDAGLVDRSSAPRSVPHRTNDERLGVIVALRKLRLTGQDIALALGMPASTVSDPDPDRAGQALATGAPGAREPLRTRTAR